MLEKLQPSHTTTSAFIHLARYEYFIFAFLIPLARGAVSVTNYASPFYTCCSSSSFDHLPPAGLLSLMKRKTGFDSFRHFDLNNIIIARAV